MKEFEHILKYIHRKDGRLGFGGYSHKYEFLILTKFYNLEFLIIGYFWSESIFYTQVSTYSKHQKWNLDIIIKVNNIHSVWINIL